VYAGPDPPENGLLKARIVETGVTHQSGGSGGHAGHDSGVLVGVVVSSERTTAPGKFHVDVSEVRAFLARQSVPNRSRSRARPARPTTPAGPRLLEGGSGSIRRESSFRGNAASKLTGPSR